MTHGGPGEVLGSRVDAHACQNWPSDGELAGGAAVKA